ASPASFSFFWFYIVAWEFLPLSERSSICGCSSSSLMPFTQPYRCRRLLRSFLVLGWPLTPVLFALSAYGKNCLAVMGRRTRCGWDSESHFQRYATPTS